jgi:hypothetical protein
MEHKTFAPGFVIADRLPEKTAIVPPPPIAPQSFPLKHVIAGRSGHMDFFLEICIESIPFV